MADTGSEDFSDLHERVLGFMGAFSSTQFAIDTVLSLFLDLRMPSLGPELSNQFLKRLRDNQRPKLFLAYADEVSYDEDLTQFSNTFEECKKLRDFIGHSLDVVGPVYSVDRPPVVGVTHLRRPAPATVPDPLLPSTFDRYTLNCEWLSQHAWRAGYVGNPDVFVDFSGNPTAPPRPVPLPPGSDPSA